MSNQTIQYVVGDATKPEGAGHKYILHVVNDKGAWGAGFVLALSRRWKQPEQDYREWAKGNANVPFALGQVLFSSPLSGVTVVNMLAQKGLRSPDNPCPLSYPALRRCLEAAARDARTLGASVHMPRVGCGLAGGEWNRVAKIVQEELCDKGIPVTVYDPPGQASLLREN